MRQIDIPFKDHKLCIYTGKKGRIDFTKKVHSVSPDWVDDNTTDGISFQNLIFIEDVKNKNVLLHEVSHFLDTLYEELACQTETEFKAYLFAYVIEEVLR